MEPCSTYHILGTQSFPSHFVLIHTQIGSQQAHFPSAKIGIVWTLLYPQEYLFSTCISGWFQPFWTTLVHSNVMQFISPGACLKIVSRFSDYHKIKFLQTWSLGILFQNQLSYSPAFISVALPISS